MGSASRPDLLPFALPSAIGLPFHGLVKNGKLTFGVDSVTHPQPTGGITNMVQHPKASSPARTAIEQAFDAARHYEFKDYALLSGDPAMIGGQPLGSSALTYYWIYCDEDYSWRVSVSYLSSSSALTATVWLEESFGLFVNDPSLLSMTRRQLATYSFPFKRYNGTNNTSASVREFLVTHSKTGAVTAVNVVMNYDANNDYRQTAQISHSFKIALSGTGSMVAGNIGDGIAAECSTLADAPDMVVTNESGEPGQKLATDYTTLSQTKVYVPGDNCDDLGAGSHSITATTTNVFAPSPEEYALSSRASTTISVVREFFYCVKPTGQIINVKEEYESKSMINGDVTGTITGNPTVTWVSKYTLHCNDCDYYGCKCTPVDSYVENASGIQSLFTEVVSAEETYTITFGDFSQSLSYSAERTTTAGYTFTYVAIPANDPYYCEASFNGDYTYTSSDTGAPPPNTWRFERAYTFVSLPSNNVIKFIGNNENKLISIIGSTAVSGDAYVSLEPSTGTIATDGADPICHV